MFNFSLFNNFSRILTDALSRTFTEAGSAYPLSRSAFSNVNRGKLSHFPYTTRSMSLQIIKIIFQYGVKDFYAVNHNKTITDDTCTYVHSL